MTPEGRGYTKALSLIFKVAMHVRTLRGLCYGRPIKLTTARRTAVTAPVPPLFLWWGDEKFEIDDYKMTQRQRKALPHGGLMVTHFRASDFEPFILEVPEFASQLTP